MKANSKRKVFGDAVDLLMGDMEEVTMPRGVQMLPVKSIQPFHDHPFHTIDEAVACPFCNHEIEKGTVAHESYIESATIEIQRIQLQISDLSSAESDVCEGIDKYESFK